MGILVIFLTLWIIWKLWGVMFDGKKVTVNPKPYTVRKLKEWRELAERKLANPESTESQKKEAIRDIEYFSGILKDLGVEV